MIMIIMMIIINEEICNLCPCDKLESIHPSCRPPSHLISKVPRHHIIITIIIIIITNFIIMLMIIILDIMLIIISIFIITGPRISGF